MCDVMYTRARACVHTHGYGMGVGVIRSAPPPPPPALSPALSSDDARLLERHRASHRSEHDATQRDADVEPLLGARGEGLMLGLGSG